MGGCLGPEVGGCATTAGWLWGTCMIPWRPHPPHGGNTQTLLKRTSSSLCSLSEFLFWFLVGAKNVGVYPYHHPLPTALPDTQDRGGKRCEGNVWSHSSGCLPAAQGPIALLCWSRAWHPPPVPTAFPEVSRKFTSSNKRQLQIECLLGISF